MRIICVGDSLTRGVTFARGRLRIVRDNYPSLLQAAFGQAADVEIMNRGAFNDNSDTLIERLDKDVLTMQPDVVIVEIGANDCNFRWDQVAANPDAEHVPYVSLKRYVDNIEKIVTTVRNTDALPVVLTLLPLDPVRYYNYLATSFGKQIAHWIAVCGGIEYWHSRYDHALRQRLTALQVDQIDMRRYNKQFTNWRDMLSEDGIHLTAFGYQKLSQSVFAALQELKSFSALSLSLSSRA